MKESGSCLDSGHSYISKNVKHAEYGILPPFLQRAQAVGIEFAVSYKFVENIRLSLPRFRSQDGETMRL